MKTITVKYGIDQFTTEVPDDFTIGQLKDDNNEHGSRIRVALGHGDNVNALVDGVTQGDGVQIPPLSCVKIETAANKKGN